MIKFAAITPHPPIIIPTIGSSSDLKKVSETIKAMEKLAKIFKKSQIETVIIISPHGPVNYDKMTITMSPTLSGNFQMFGDSKTELNFENDLELVDIFQEKCKEQKIPTRILDFPRLDHGCLVPLYYLTKSYALKKGKTLKVVPIAYSYLDSKTHFDFGKIIHETCNMKYGTNKRIGIIASGDLSHRLTFDAPAGFSFEGPKFDKKLVKLLKGENFKEILNMDTDLIKEAGECGYLSIIILLGALSGFTGFKKPKFKFLSYQKPFGVGYLTGYFSL